jgi:hypothetical protein
MQLFDLLKITDKETKLNITLGDKIVYNGNAEKLNIGFTGIDTLTLEVKRQFIKTYVLSNESTLNIEL